MATVDDYLALVKPSQRNILEAFRKMVKELVPDAEESVSYGVPTFKYQKKPLIYYAAFANHMSIYPASDEMVAVVGKELADFRTSTGTLQFTETKQIPATLLKKIIQFRLVAVSK